MSDRSKKYDGSVVTHFLRAFYNALQAAHARYLIKYPANSKEFGAFVNQALLSPGYFDKWFFDYPELRFSEQIVSRLIFARAVEYKLLNDTEIKELRPLHEEYISYLNVVDGHSNIASASIDKQHVAVVSKMLIESGITHISRLTEYEEFISFIQKHVVSYANIGKISTATRNSKIIISKLVGRDEFRLSAIRRGDQTNWLASYAALMGALAAVQAEDHKALAFFETTLSRLRLDTSNDKFIAAAHKAVSYLSRKYWLDLSDEKYPTVGPAMESYKLLISNSRSLYEIPKSIQAAIYKGFSVEFRHQGAISRTKTLIDQSTTLNEIHEIGIQLAVSASNTQLQIQMMLSKAWTHFKQNELSEAEIISRKCRDLSRTIDRGSIIHAEVGELTGYLSFDTALPLSSQFEASQEFLLSVAAKFEEIGSISRAESILAKIPKK